MCWSTTFSSKVSSKATLGHQHQVKFSWRARFRELRNQFVQGNVIQRWPLGVGGTLPEIEFASLVWTVNGLLEKLDETIHLSCSLSWTFKWNSAVRAAFDTVQGPEQWEQAQCGPDLPSPISCVCAIYARFSANPWCYLYFFNIFSQSTGEKSSSFPSQLSVLNGKENIGVHLWKSPNFVVDSESRSCMYVHISDAVMLLRVDSSYVSEGAGSGVSNITWGYCWLANKSPVYLKQQE